MRSTATRHESDFLGKSCYILPLLSIPRPYLPAPCHLMWHLAAYGGPGAEQAARTKVGIKNIFPPRATARCSGWGGRGDNKYMCKGGTRHAHTGAAINHSVRAGGSSVGPHKNAPNRRKPRRKSCSNACSAFTWKPYSPPSPAHLM